VGELNKRPKVSRFRTYIEVFKFIKLEAKTLQLLVFIDASFTNNKDLSSQIAILLY